MPFTFYFTFLLCNHRSSSTKNLQGEKQACTIKGNYTPSTHMHTIKILWFSMQRNRKPSIFQIPPHNNFQNHIHSLWKFFWITLPCSLVQKSGLTSESLVLSGLLNTQLLSKAPQPSFAAQNSLCVPVLLLYETQNPQTWDWRAALPSRRW